MPLFKQPRVIYARYSTTSTTTIATTDTQITYGTQAFDNVNAMSGATWTVPAWFSGALEITGGIGFASTAWSGSSGLLLQYKNGSFDSIIAVFSSTASSATAIQVFAFGATLVNVVGGDTLTWYAYQTQTGGGIALNGSASANRISIYGVMP